MNKVLSFFSETKSELAKVAWSSPRDLTKATIVVLCGTFFLTIVIFVVDLALSNALKLILK